MNIIRILIKNTSRRKVSHWCAALSTAAVLIVVLRYEDTLARNDDLISRSLQVFAVVTSFLSVLANNLRNKSLEYYIKFLEKNQKIHDPIRTGRIITNLSFLSFITSVFLVISSCFPYIQFKLYILLPLCVYMGIMCAIQYVYLLFSLEILDEAAIKAADTDYISKHINQSHD